MNVWAIDQDRKREVAFSGGTTVFALLYLQQLFSYYTVYLAHSTLKHSSLPFFADAKTFQWDFSLADYSKLSK